MTIKDKNNNRSIAQLGNKNCLGKHWELTEKRKKEISKFMIGNKNGINAWKGKHHSENTIKKMSNLRKIFLIINNVSLIRENNPNWKGGLSYKPYSCLFNEQLKSRILKRDKWTCKNPSCKIKLKKVKMIKYKTDNSFTIHHIDYDKQNIKIDNLISLCRICNLKANSNRNYWKILYQNIIKEENKYEQKKINNLCDSNTNFHIPSSDNPAKFN